MATKSILKTIHIKKRDPAKSLINALEHAEGKGSKTVVMSRGYSQASRVEISKIFGKKHDDAGL